VDETAADPITALADKYFHLPCSVMTPNNGRLETIRNSVSEYRPQCVIELICQACLTYDVESNRVKRMIQDEPGLAYLRIETDCSSSDAARIATRIETLSETLRSAACAPVY
jgi:benzoyl-CoA reductase/2-hydroxyglutaryl-CoA dehydratase subunit BcrC/BadD/HgdB